MGITIQAIKERRDEDLLVLPTDAVLFEDSSFKVSEGSHVAKNCTIYLVFLWTKSHDGFSYLKIYAEKYAKDQDAFFEDYAEAHAKLSNLGAKFDPPKVKGIRTPSILER